MFLVNSESTLLLVLLNICCIAIVLKPVFVVLFQRLKALCLKLLKIFLYLCNYFVQKTAQLSLEIVTQERLVVESCPTPR